MIKETGCNGCILLYQEKGIIKKAKLFLEPYNSTNRVKKYLNHSLNEEYHLWLDCLYHYGYLEEDDAQLLEYKRLDKKNII